ncbi:MAG: squalene synthetase-like protein [Claussenomyces sp. TS43310]|nr:MAG: squalene synthetase-like protein [Claussenomyces sp. TS43310]
MAYIFIRYASRHVESCMRTNACPSPSWPLHAVSGDKLSAPPAAKGTEDGMKFQSSTDITWLGIESQLAAQHLDPDSSDQDNPPARAGLIQRRGNREGGVLNERKLREVDLLTGPPSFKDEAAGACIDVQPLLPSTTTDRWGKRTKYKAELMEGELIGASAQPLGPQSKGFSMMSKMGWTPGSGLGARNQGFVESIPLLMKTSRQGLGARNPIDFAPNPTAHENNFSDALSGQMSDWDQSLDTDAYEEQIRKHKAEWRANQRRVRKEQEPPKKNKRKYKNHASLLVDFVCEALPDGPRCLSVLADFPSGQGSRVSYHHRGLLVRVASVVDGDFDDLGMEVQFGDELQILERLYKSYTVINQRTSRMGRMSILCVNMDASQAFSKKDLERQAQASPSMETMPCHPNAVEEDYAIEADGGVPI